MTQTVKNSLKSALVLSIVAVIAVGLLVLANAFFPKYQPKLDLAKVKELNKIVDVGVDDETALSGNYYEFLASESKTDKFNLDRYNKEMRTSERRSVSDSLLAIYSVKLGDAAGAIITETLTVGYNGQETILLIAFDKNGIVTGVSSQHALDDYYYYREGNATDYYARLNELLVGQNALTASSSFDVEKSGATISSNAVDFGVKLAFGAAKQLLGGAK